MKCSDCLRAYWAEKDILDENVPPTVGRGPKGLSPHLGELTNLAAEGVLDTVARPISGHRTPSVHARYQITQESAKRAALAKMSARVAQLAQGS